MAELPAKYRDTGLAVAPTALRKEGSSITGNENAFMTSIAATSSGQRLDFCGQDNRSASYMPAMTINRDIGDLNSAQGTFGEVFWDSFLPNGDWGEESTAD